MPARLHTHAGTPPRRRWRGAALWPGRRAKVLAWRWAVVWPGCWGGGPGPRTGVVARPLTEVGAQASASAKTGPAMSMNPPWRSAPTGTAGSGSRCSATATAPSRRWGFASLAFQ
ncbi:hypothetical protein GCM10010254_48170 [Streptomyces chromofuscus]|nr:hypothetical protein GCM10010254_48170 [Streptomyces chromofuscus]